MEAHTRVKRNIQSLQQKENATTKSKNVLIDARKNSKSAIQKIKGKNTNQKEVDTNLGLPKCSRGVTKRTALGSIVNNAPLISNKNNPTKGGKVDAKNRKAGLIKKIEASKVLVGLKSRKENNQKTIPENALPRTIPTDLDVKHDLQEVKTIFKLPEGVDNIDAEW